MPILSAILAAAAVQSVLSKGVTVTCRLEETLAFYRDVLNQTVAEDSVRDGARVAQYVDIRPTAKVRIVSLHGADGGGRFGFIGIEDPASPACLIPAGSRTAGKAVAGDVLFSVRVTNLDEVAVRAMRAGAPILVAPGISGSGQARNMMMLDPNGRIVEALELVTAPAKR